MKNILLQFITKNILLQYITVNFLYFTFDGQSNKPSTKNVVFVIKIIIVSNPVFHDFFSSEIASNYNIFLFSCATTAFDSVPFILVV